ncbi:MAG TPA: hypothetical protein VKY22_16515 [Bradyrhizobium sp.]|nr:hypothetical protein [Bradyrhizobium sp.]
MLVEKVHRTRNRAKQEFPLKTRLERAAGACRDAARRAGSEAEREMLLRRARRYEVTAHLDEWLSSPGLQPPE